MGALIGCVAGALRHATVALENRYCALDMSYLAARTIADGSLEWTLRGVVTSAAAVGVTLALWPLCRLLRGDWRRGFSGAATAVPLIGLYGFAGWYVNYHYLPGKFTVPSIAANLLRARP